ncbi:unnamed protein product, partial [Ectocarpus sp. 12 AP-2014]
LKSLGATQTHDVHLGLARGCHIARRLYLPCTREQSKKTVVSAIWSTALDAQRCSKFLMDANNAVSSRVLRWSMGCHWKSASHPEPDVCH